MAKVHFTADTHFGHASIIRMAGRPFTSVEEHDQALIDNWNAVVAPADTVFVVGDFAHKADNDRARKIFERLRGTKHLVIGNHDSEFVRTGLPWASVMDRVKITVDGQKIVLDHYPMRSWEGVRSGAIQLYGHVHNRIDVWPNSCDVGVDCWGYRPVTLLDIRARLDAAPHHLMEEYVLDDGEVPAEGEDVEVVNGVKL
ncbi:metallophosphoesterase family protein [Devosia salina]|uniref:Metallophosphoesterase family protein n=1 Tax=Devosia salina TaxID=2860336 RepID=A0ABX8W9G6_9HYPH|nr:metallophosphoesterase family protein [Devosia salina]QYO75614.1 metallophosphoesterase family protein [Devosia salina]